MQCWQIIYFGLLSHPTSRSSKDREATVLCSSLNVYIICIQPLSCQPCTAEPLPYNSTRGCRPTTRPHRMAWRSTGGVQQRAQHHFYRYIATVALKTAAASSASPEQAGGVVQEQYNCSIYVLAGFLDIQKPSLLLDQSSRVVCYFSEKCGRLLLTW